MSIFYLVNRDLRGLVLRRTPFPVRGLTNTSPICAFILFPLVFQRAPITSPFFSRFSISARSAVRPRFLWKSPNQPLSYDIRDISRTTADFSRVSKHRRIFPLSGWRQGLNQDYPNNVLSLPRIRSRIQFLFYLSKILVPPLRFPLMCLTTGDSDVTYWFEFNSSKFGNKVV